jgi:hypothetical protein
MSDSTKWALERLEKANAINEPDEKPLGVQLTDLLIWAVECAVAYGLALLMIHWAGRV